MRKEEKKVDRRMQKFLIFTEIIPNYSDKTFGM